MLRTAVRVTRSDLVFSGVYPDLAVAVDGVLKEQIDRLVSDMDNTGESATSK